MLNIIAICTIMLLLCPANSEYPIERPIMRVRNQYLRFYVMHKKSKLKKYIIETSNKAYNSVLSKIYDAQYAYYSLSDEDRELIEQIINLHF